MSDPRITAGAGRWADRPDARLLLILSSERSGSTLLRFMLGAHSRMVSPSELFVLRYPDYATWRAQKPVAMESVLEYFRLLGREMTAAEVDAACGDHSASDALGWLLEQLPPGRMLIDKTPAYANEPDSLERSLALHPFCIWLIRHPLGVIDSQVRLKEKLWRRKAQRHGLSTRLRARVLHITREWTGANEGIARKREGKWVRQNRNIAAFLRRVPDTQHCTVYFEDMVRDPEAALARVCAGMGLTVEAGMSTLGGRPPEMNPHLGDPNFHQHREVDAEMAEGWAARFAESWLAPDTRRLMAEIGVRSAGTAPRASA